MKSFSARRLAPAALLAAAATGKTQFERTCANCHSIEVGVNKVGPTLFEIVDRPVASVQGHDYSPKMRSQRRLHKVWGDRRIDSFSVSSLPFAKMISARRRSRRSGNVARAGTAKCPSRFGRSW